MTSLKRPFSGVISAPLLPMLPDTSVDWETYPILTFADVPIIEIVLLDRQDEAWLGVGEGMVGPTAAAIANAVCNAMGVRVRDMPITRERILAAME